jgi:hypothetical protein
MQMLNPAKPMTSVTSEASHSTTQEVSSASLSSHIQSTKNITYCPVLPHGSNPKSKPLSALHPPVHPHNPNMSFLYRSNVALRSAAARPSPRLFSTAVIYRKSATETVKDGLKAVDRTVADVAVKGIDAGGRLCQIEQRRPCTRASPSHTRQKLLTSSPTALERCTNT